jgi:hypothetical protein
MSDQALPRRTNNVRTAIVVAVILLLVAVLPWACRNVVEPSQRFPTAAAARASADADEWVPAFLPANATDVIERHGVGRRFVRFSADSATLTAVTAPLTQLDTFQIKRIPIPTPGYAGWWSITPRTLQGGQGKQIRVYRVESPRDQGYVAVDPRSWRAFYWATPAGR